MLSHVRPALVLAVVAGSMVGCSSWGGRDGRSDGDGQRDTRRDERGGDAAGSADWRREMNPQMRTVITKLEGMGGKPIESLTPAEARRQPTPTDAVVALLREQGKPTTPPPGLTVAMRTVPGAEGRSVPVRTYTPAGMTGGGTLPTIVYVHGGGWVIATLDTYDASARALATKVNAVVVSVDYRMAPEYKFPAAHEDVYAVLQHAMSADARFGGDPARVAIAGESAGGNMATAACMMAAERGGRMPVHQLLVYPVADYAFDTPSYRDNAQAKPLNKAMMPWFFGHYLRSAADGKTAWISPLGAAESALRPLPDATIITAEIDPLRSEGMMYADKLKKAGVGVVSRNYKGVTHEFFGMDAVVDEAKAAQDFAAGRLRAALGANSAAVSAPVARPKANPTNTSPDW